MKHTDSSYIIGLTGPTGAGKSTVAEWLLGQGVQIIDCDALARLVVEPKKPALCKLAETFGTAILLKDGSLDRKKLAELAFSDEENRKTLNRITHFYITQEIQKRIAASHGYVLIDAPLLFEAGLEKICDTVIAVTAAEDTRMARIIDRDGIDRIAAQKRISAQASSEEYAKKADYVIENNGDTAALYRRLTSVWREIREKQK